MLVISITRKVSLADGQPYIPPFFKINRCLLFHFCLTYFNDIVQFICMHKTEGNPDGTWLESKLIKSRQKMFEERSLGVQAPVDSRVEQPC